MSIINRKNSYHFIGIGGIGVSAVARILWEQGHKIQGSDVRESQLTEGLRALGVDVFIGHDARYVEGVDYVVYSTAVPANNIEWQTAKKQNIPCIHRSEALAHCLSQHESIGVVGTHGKGTVSAMIAHALISLDQDPTFIIGGILNQYATNARLGKEYAVVEIDESDGSHLNLFPHHVVLNNLEVDHLNYYDDFNAIIDQMLSFIKQNENLKYLAINWTDEGARILAKKLTRPVIKYGVILPSDDMNENQANTLLSELDFSARHLQDDGYCVHFDVYQKEECLGKVTLPIPGSYNVGNAMGAIALLSNLGFSFIDYQSAFNSYQGLENRFTLRRAGGIQIVKDYLSHPTGMKRVLDSAQHFQARKIHCVFKPYRFTLMRYHANDYADAFQAADEILITTMYAANEKSIEGIDTPWFVACLRKAGNTTHFIPKQEEIIDVLHQHVHPGDLVFFFGGDDFFRMADAWADDLDQQSLSDS